MFEARLYRPVAAHGATGGRLSVICGMSVGYLEIRTFGLFDLTVFNGLNVDDPRRGRRSRMGERHAEHQRGEDHQKNAGGKNHARKLPQSSVIRKQVIADFGAAN
ncbi:MAG: hypothetical protein KKF33_07590 [Alphaproteobacteria bacterium]|nr:hypothetical protein [Alphaproteobacteria bacterium]